MNAQELVLTACEFRKPERIPRFDSFWEYPQAWRERLGPPEDLTDVEIWVPDETTFPTRARNLRRTGGWVYEVDGWGRTIRQKPGSYFSETLEVPIPVETDPDSVAFDSPSYDARYQQGCANQQDMLDLLAQGLIYKEIGEKLGISYETVHTYIRRIYEKLQVRTRTEAVAKFLRN